MKLCAGAEAPGELDAEETFVGEPTKVKTLPRHLNPTGQVKYDRPALSLGEHHNHELHANVSTVSGFKLVSQRLSCWVGGSVSLVGLDAGLVLSEALLDAVDQVSVVDFESFQLWSYQPGWIQPLKEL